MPTNSQKLAALRELKKRADVATYASDFEKFAKDMIKIMPKNRSAGFTPLAFNDAQKQTHNAIEAQLKETGKVRCIILKSRQQGLSTYCAARVYWKSYFNAHQKALILAHDAPTSLALFELSRNIIDQMPPAFRPTFAKSNAREMTFDHNASSYRLFTAGSPEAGRGMSPSLAHCSEASFWPHDERILAGLFNGVSNDLGTEILIESTANGTGNEFHRLWLGAIAGEGEYIPIFIPWFTTAEYAISAPPEMELNESEEVLQKQYNLTNDQIYWRRLKVAEGGELRFAQEYPSSWTEAFLTSGSSVFDIEKLNALIPQPILASKEFNFESKHFDDNRHGTFQIFKHPKAEDCFVIGADVSLGVGKDSSAAVVMNEKKEVCAVFVDNGIDPSLFGDLLFYISRLFNNALLAVESNALGIATINRLSQMGHTNLYYQTKAANVSKENGLRIGFRTTTSSKPMIIGFLKAAITAEEIWIPSKRMIRELLNYTADDAGRTNAAAGHNDDTVIALAIALEVIRTHGDRLTNTNISFKQRMGQFQPDDTKWL